MSRPTILRFGDRVRLSAVGRFTLAGVVSEAGWQPSDRFNGPSLRALDGRGLVEIDRPMRRVRPTPAGRAVHRWGADR